MSETVMRTKERIEALADRFLAGETTLDEERELTVLCQGDDCPETLRPLRLMLEDLRAIRTTDLRTIEHKRPARHLRLYWMAAASALLLLTAVGIAVHQERGEECVAYIYGQKCTDRALVMEEIRQTIGDLQQDGDGVENQLQDIFSTNDEGL